MEGKERAEQRKLDNDLRKRKEGEEEEEGGGRYGRGWDGGDQHGKDFLVWRRNWSIPGSLSSTSPKNFGARTPTFVKAFAEVSGISSCNFKF